jgi:hypothetical protein
MNTQTPTEDISVIVSRFQAWAGSQAVPQPKEGVRELTYEEAIRRRQSAYRRELDPIEPSKKQDAESKQVAKRAKPKKRHRASGRAKDGIPKPPTAVAASGSSVNYPTASFQKVLENSVSILPAATTNTTALTERRTTALSLRISAAEQALLKRRAMESNLSVSGYLRNCIFEVEELRAQLKLSARQPAIQVKPEGRGFLYFLRCIFLSRPNKLALRA